MKTCDVKRDNFMIHVIVTLLFMFGFGYLPPVEPITPIGMKMLGIFIGLVYAWSTTSLLWPTFVGMLAIVSSGVFTMTDFSKLSFGHETVVFIILVTAFAMALNEAGLVKFLSSWIISRKIVEGRPWVFTLMILMGAFLGGMLVNSLASVIFFWSILYSVCKEFDMKPYDKYPSLMVFGIVFASMTAGMTVLPFRMTALIVLGALKSVTDISVSFAEYVAFTLPMGILLILAYFGTMKYIFRCDLTCMKGISVNFVDKNDLLLDKKQKFAFFLTVLMILLLIGADLLKVFLPEFFLTKLLMQWGVVGIILLILSLALIVRIDGVPFMDFKKAMQGVDWGMTYLFAIILPFSSLLTSDITGIKLFLIQTLSPLFLGKPFIIFAAIVLIIGTVLTNMANNAVLLVIFINVCAPICGSLGVSPVPLVMCMLWCFQLAYMTPGASGPAAFVFGNAEWIKPTMMYKYIAVIIIVLFFVSFGIGLPAAMAIFQ